MVSCILLVAVEMGVDEMSEMCSFEAKVLKQAKGEVKEKDG